MKYQFELRSPIQGTIIEVDADLISRGEIVATGPRDAATQIVAACRPDLVEDNFDHLAPVFTVERNRDGTFSVDVDTHGLVDASIELETVA